MSTHIASPPAGGGVADNKGARKRPGLQHNATASLCGLDGVRLEGASKLAAHSTIEGHRLHYIRSRGDVCGPSRARRSIRTTEGALAMHLTHSCADLHTQGHQVSNQKHCTKHYPCIAPSPSHLPPPRVYVLVYFLPHTSRASSVHSKAIVTGGEAHRIAHALILVHHSSECHITLAQERSVHR